MKKYIIKATDGNYVELITNATLEEVRKVKDFAGLDEICKEKGGRWATFDADRDVHIDHVIKGW